MRKANRRQGSSASIWSAAVLSLALVFTFTPCCDVLAAKSGSGANVPATSSTDLSHDSVGGGDQHVPDSPCQPTWLDTAADMQRDLGLAGGGKVFLQLASIDRQVPLLLSPGTGVSHAAPRSIGPPLYLRFGRLLN